MGNNSLMSRSSWWIHLTMTSWRYTFPKRRRNCSRMIFEDFFTIPSRPGKIWPRPISWLEPEGKIWVWVGVFRPGNKDGVNPYPTRKTMGRVNPQVTWVDPFFKGFFFFWMIWNLTIIKVHIMPIKKTILKLNLYLK